MKLKLNITIVWFSLSLISLIFVFVQQNRKDENIGKFVSKYGDNYVKQGNAGSELFLRDIKKSARAYPEQKEYLTNSLAIDSLTKAALSNLQNADLKDFETEINDKYLSNDGNLKTYYRSFWQVSNDTLAKWQIKPWSANLFKKSRIIYHNVNLLIQYERITCYRCGLFFNSYEPVIFSNILTPLRNEKVTVMMGLASSGESYRIKNQKIWVNETALPTKDGKSRFKHKTTRSGWYDMNVRITAEYLGKPITSEVVYQYYVCP